MTEAKSKILAALAALTKVRAVEACGMTFHLRPTTLGGMIKARAAGDEGGAMVALLADAMCDDKGVSLGMTDEDIRALPGDVATELAAAINTDADVSPEDTPAGN